MHLKMIRRATCVDLTMPAVDVYFCVVLDNLRKAGEAVKVKNRRGEMALPPPYFPFRVGQSKGNNHSKGIIRLKGERSGEL